MSQELDTTAKKLETIKRMSKANVEYWMARDIQEALDYSRWENFQKVIERARMACEGSGIEPENHFRETTKMVTIGSGAVVTVSNYYLSRYACYLIAMNGDTSKPVIATAQTYFAYQTRKQEIEEALTNDEKRILLRDRVKEGNKKLAGAAKAAGVRQFPLFQDAGYCGLYGGMGLGNIKDYKGLDSKDDLLDRAGRAELAANEFRITQTEEKLVRERVATEYDAINTHRSVGARVREAIQEIGGTMPEDLAPEPSIKKLKSDLKKAKKALNG
ncbi:MAG: DNA damage-inducible protein D [Candidatus Aquicultorales bacterium]